MARFVATVENAVPKFLLYVESSKRVTPVLKELYCLVVENRTQFLKIMVVYNL